ncbi:MAG: UDP-N-acetylglucosamine 2-epimerase (non-hydrolyzing) [Bacteroidales bacterium]|nr:UDP-N-acetylglucosamine 2-epimerase (non-hydrolyzing) [Bacteroidales bacterium]
MKILSVVGARPQFVKAAVVSAEIVRNPEVTDVLVHTGQHFDDNMSQLFFEEMGLRKPDYYLNIHSLPHEEMVAEMQQEIEQVIHQEQPDWVLVYGDTDSTLAGARAAHECGVKLCHVEAGLRSFNPKMQEEYNRIQTDRISDLLCVPTQVAAENLRREGLDMDRVVLTGDVMKDAARAFLPLARKPQVDIPEKFVLCTLHRAENTDNSEVLKELILSLELIAEFVPVVLPLHPRTKNKLNEIAYPFEISHIQFIDPVGYLEMLYLLNHCRLVLTDSGGVQKEAYFAHKYCLTLREETEWVELCARGYNHLLGHNHLDIVTTTRNFLEMPPLFADDLYGNGHAASVIVSEMLVRSSL